MTTRFTHFTFLMSLMLVFSTGLHAQKFLTKGDLKPIIDNVIIWQATHTSADIDRTSSTAMGVGSFNGDGVADSGTSEGVEGNNDTTENTNNPVENTGDVTEAGNGDDNSTVTINPGGGLLLENNLPSRGGGSTNADADADGNTDTDSTEVDTTESDEEDSTSSPTDNDLIPVIEVNGMSSNVLEEIMTYPNPASEQINVLVPMMNQMVRIRLISMSGQPVIDRTAYGNSRVVLETYNLPEGVYLIEFTGDSQQFIKRTYIKR